MFQPKSNSASAESPSPPELVCTLVIDAMLNEFEVEICCQRTNGVDRVFSPTMNWLSAERPSTSTLANSVEALMPSLIMRCLTFVGKPVDVWAGLLGKERVGIVINASWLEMDEIEKGNEVSRKAAVVAKAEQLGLAPEASRLIRGTWTARCPGTNHTLELQPKKNLFCCGYCKVGGGIEKLKQFSAHKRWAPRSSESDLFEVTGYGTSPYAGVKRAQSRRLLAAAVEMVQQSIRFEASVMSCAVPSLALSAGAV